MKTSTKILLGSGAAVLIAMLGFLIVARIIAGGVVSLESFTTPPSLTPVTQILETESFHALHIGGLWKIKLVRDNALQVRLTIPEYLSEHIQVEVRDEELFLDFKPGTRFRPMGSYPEVEIWLPHLDEIKVLGAAEFDLEGLQEQRFRLDMSGGASLTGVDCTLENLEIDISGAAEIDLKQSRVRNAIIDISGAGAVKLTMAHL